MMKFWKQWEKLRDVILKKFEQENRKIYDPRLIDEGEKTK